MRYIWQHIATILTTYDGSLPLSHFLKNYFKQYPILGSRDRKILSEMAYCWYRCSKGFGYDTDVISNEHIAGKIRNCLEVCKSSVLGNDKLFGSPENTVAHFDEQKLFPYQLELSEGIDRGQWLHSMLVQPDLFIRVRKDKNKVIELLQSEHIAFSHLTDNCIALPNGAKIDGLLPPDCYVVQDASSQYTGAFFRPQKGEWWYDCCSGAGGKSLLLKDIEPGVQLTVSDKRESIIHNLEQRFRLYGHKRPESFVIDASERAELAKIFDNREFDNIICDAPCSGSGTWARTPEQLYFFDPVSFGKYPELQKAIGGNVSPYLKPGGLMIYITCSVFRKENGDVVRAIATRTRMEVVAQQTINGISNRADSMFVAVFKK